MSIWTGIRFVSGGSLFPTNVAPGEEKLISLYAECSFRPERAAREEGIDYSAFVVREIWIGGDSQWHESSAEDLFSKFRAPMDPVLVGLIVQIVVRNASVKPQPFVVSLEGRVLR